MLYAPTPDVMSTSSGDAVWVSRVCALDVIVASLSSLSKRTYDELWGYLSSPSEKLFCGTLPLVCDVTPPAKISNVVQALNIILYAMKVWTGKNVCLLLQYG